MEAGSRSGPADAVCAWCGRDLEGGGSAVGEQAVSHGMCPSCADLLSAELGVSLERFLGGLDVPVFVVDVAGGGRVIMSSEEGRALVGKDEAGLRDELLGDVFECANAALPGGCGRTVHCSGCTIRNSVEHSWATGEALERVPATLKPGGAGAPPKVALEISTERVDDKVLLRIHHATPGLGSRAEGGGS